MLGRKWLFGLTAALGMAATASGEPPVYPLVEGREPDPVARQFHEPDRPIAGYVATAEPAAPSTWLSMTVGVWEVLLDRLTFPLGIAVPSEERLGG